MAKKKLGQGLPFRRKENESLIDFLKREKHEQIKEKKPLKYNKRLNPNEQSFYRLATDFFSLEYAKRNALLNHTYDYCQSKDLYKYIFQKMMTKECCDKYCLQKAIDSLLKNKNKKSFIINCNSSQKKSSNFFINDSSKESSDKPDLTRCLTFREEKIEEFSNLRLISKGLLNYYNTCEYNLFTDIDISDVLINWEKYIKHKKHKGARLVDVEVSNDCYENNSDNIEKKHDKKANIYSCIPGFIFPSPYPNKSASEKILIKDVTKKTRKKPKEICISIDISKPKIQLKDLQEQFFSILLDYIDLPSFRESDESLQCIGNGFFSYKTYEQENENFIIDLINKKTNRFIQGGSIEWRLVGLWLWDRKKFNDPYNKKYSFDSETQKKDSSCVIDFEKFACTHIQADINDPIYESPDVALKKTEDEIKNFIP